MHWYFCIVIHKWAFSHFSAKSPFQFSIRLTILLLFFLLPAVVLIPVSHSKDFSSGSSSMHGSFIDDTFDAHFSLLTDIWFFKNIFNTALVDQKSRTFWLGYFHRESWDLYSLPIHVWVKISLAKSRTLHTWHKTLDNFNSRFQTSLLGQNAKRIHTFYHDGYKGIVGRPGRRAFQFGRGCFFYWFHILSSAVYSWTWWQVNGFRCYRRRWQRENYRVFYSAKFIVFCGLWHFHGWVLGDVQIGQFLQYFSKAILM